MFLLPIVPINYSNAYECLFVAFFHNFCGLSTIVVPLNSEDSQEFTVLF